MTIGNLSKPAAESKKKRDRESRFRPESRSCNTTLIVPNLRTLPSLTYLPILPNLLANVIHPGWRRTAMMKHNRSGAIESVLKTM